MPSSTAVAMLIQSNCTGSAGRVTPRQMATKHDHRLTDVVGSVQTMNLVEVVEHAAALLHGSLNRWRSYRR